MNTVGTKIETRLIHGGVDPEEAKGAAVTPVFQNTAFAYRTAEELEAVFAGREPGFVYSRMGNPTVASFERRMTILEGGLGAVACSSGMAAISSLVLSLAGSGDEIVSSNSVFGGTYSLFRSTLSRSNIRTRFVEAADIDSYRNAVNDRTKMIFIETMGNPKLDVPDIAAVAGVAREMNVVLVVDNTVTSPVLVQPAQLGADIVIHSASKYINGHGNSIGGIIVDSGSFDWSNKRYAHLAESRKRLGNYALLAVLKNQICRDMGCCLSPFNAFLLTLGMESLALRMERHCDNAAKTAESLSASGLVEEVRYAGLSNHPNHKLAERQFNGRFGALLTFRLGSKERCFKFINGLKMIQNMANLGDTRTLVLHPASTFCRDMNDEERRAVGVTDDLIRMSIGLEHIDDILGDIKEALGRL